MEFLRRAYQHVFFDTSDPRVKDWPFMSSPVPGVIVVVTYLVLIKVILPIYMRNRKPYDLRRVIKWYNIIQITANTICAWGLLTSGWTTTFDLRCAPPDYSTNPEPMRMLRFLWWTMMLKLFEFVETFFFVLRKKDRQASFLHVYHHVSSFFILWQGTKYVGGGLTSFPPMLNNAVHVIMYTYYLLSAEGSPGIKKFLTKYKRWLTILQMVQFTVMIIYPAQVFLPNCRTPMTIIPFYYFNVIFVFYMFNNFYKQNYVSKKNKQGKESLNGIKNGKTVQKFHEY